MVTVYMRQIRVPPGQTVLIDDVSWEEFEAILEELGNHRGTRLAYHQGTLEIMAPLPEHEKAKVVISDLIKILLDEYDMAWESLGSATFRRADMAAGLEPDDCFYIQHHTIMIGRDRVDLHVDPPPDLALEVDSTSPTQLQAYAALRVPEIWRYHDRTLHVYVWRDQQYVLVPHSPTFPNIPIPADMMPFVEMSRTTGTAPALRAFRQWVRAQKGV
jgi:Uma2 family endonuclease